MKKLPKPKAYNRGTSSCSARLLIQLSYLNQRGVMRCSASKELCGAALRGLQSTELKNNAQKGDFCASCCKI